MPSAASSVTPTTNGPEPTPGDAFETRAPESATTSANAHTIRTAENFLTTNPFGRPPLTL